MKYKGWKGKIKGGGSRRSRPQRMAYNDGKKGFYNVYYKNTI